jgi:aminoglycoside phosphotransferase (APT) family kinase protein
MRNSTSSATDAQAMERRSPLVDLNRQQLEEALRSLAPSATLVAHSVAKSGRSNTNYVLETSEGKLVLRVHGRDDGLGAKERAIYERCRRLVPLAPLLGTSADGACVGHAFSLLEFVAGDTLESVMVAGASERLEAAACNLGHALAQLVTCQFERGGDLVARAGDTALVVRPWPFDDFERSVLFESRAATRLGPLRDEVWDFLERARRRYQHAVGPHLVHGDFNPSNLLIAEDGEITAILDWEFAHSGHVWADIGNLLRYRGVPLPESFTVRLLEGLTDGGFRPPNDWHALSLLADLSSALDFLSSADDHPQTHARALSQIRGTLAALRE